jgi:hypothetical protein
MATVLTRYNILSKYLSDGIVDLGDDTIKLALLTSSHTPAVTHTVFADIDNELSSGSGYTSGGAALSNLSLTETAGVTVWDADNVLISSLTATFRHGVLYVDDTKDTIVKPLIAYILFDDTPSDVVVSGIDFVLQWHSNGIFEIGGV